MSYSPRSVTINAKSPIKTPLLRLGERVVMSDDFTNGPAQWDVTGGGTVDIVDEVLEVVTGTADTILDSSMVNLLPGTDYIVEVDVVSNLGQVEVSVGEQVVIPATTDTGLLTGTFAASATDLITEVVVSGAEGSVVEINNVRVKLFF